MALDGDEAIVDEIDVPMEAVTVDIATDGITAVTSDDDAAVDSDDEIGEERDCILDVRKIDLDEQREVTKFFENGCGCNLYDGKPCYQAFTKEHFCTIRDQCSSFDRHDQYNVLFGHVMATVQASEHVHRNGRPSTDRQRVTGEFLHEGMKVQGNFFKSKILPLFFTDL